MTALTAFLCPPRLLGSLLAVLPLDDPEDDYDEEEDDIEDEDEDDEDEEDEEEPEWYVGPANPRRCLAFP